MVSAAIRMVELAPHPDSRAGAVQRFAVGVRRERGGRLALAYSIEGDLARLRLPPPAAPRIAQTLWRHTCCECFIALPGGHSYHEFNLAPSSEWAAYAFSRYRKGALLADEALDPWIGVQRNAVAFKLDASLPLARLSGQHATGALRVALSAVIEERDGVLSYWALRHPPGKPDFHHADAFALEIDAMEHGDEVRN